MSACGRQCNAWVHVVDNATHECMWSTMQRMSACGRQCNANQMFGTGSGYLSSGSATLVYPNSQTIRWLTWSWRRSSWGDLPSQSPQETSSALTSWGFPLRGKVWWGPGNVPGWRSSEPCNHQLMVEPLCLQQFPIFTQFSGLFPFPPTKEAIVVFDGRTVQKLSKSLTRIWTELYRIALPPLEKQGVCCCESTTVAKGARGVSMATPGLSENQTRNTFLRDVSTRMQWWGKLCGDPGWNLERVHSDICITYIKMPLIGWKH